MITVIAEHSVDLTLLPEKADVLDLGCRGFLFADELRRLGCFVWTVDVDPEVRSDDDIQRMFHYQLAISNYDGKCSLNRTPDPQAVTIKTGDDIACITLANLSQRVCVKMWDLIKIDIEGSEYEVIMSLTEPPAKQLSIEFHLHTGIYGIQDVRKMEAKLHSLGYEFASHEMTSQHGMGMNYWDSLFILK